MNFELTDDQILLRTATRRFAEEQLAPTRRSRENAHAIDPELIRALGDQGLLGINVPARWGGCEAGPIAYAVALREIARVDASVAVTMAVTNMVGEVISRFGSPGQVEEHASRLCSGEYFGGAFALSEPGAGSDAANLSTKAERDGDHWVINGQKMWITTGDQSGVVVVWARTGGEGHRGISCFLVPGDARGLSAGNPEEKMGLRASHTVALSLEEVRVPASSLLGEEGGGFSIAMAALDGGRIGISAQALGMAQAAYDEAIQHALQRQQFGSALAQFQAIQFKLADMVTEMEAAWLLTLRSAWLKEQEKTFYPRSLHGQGFLHRSSQSGCPRGGTNLGWLWLHGRKQCSPLIP